MHHRLIDIMLRQIIHQGRLTIKYKDTEYHYGSPNDELHGIIIVKKKNFFSSILYHGEVGLGESFVNEGWESPSIQTVMLVLMINYKLYLKTIYFKLPNIIS